MMRLFLISLGVTCLASVILFLYFRNRVGRMEQKVDLMFQLIQEYEQTKNIAATRTFEPTLFLKYKNKITLAKHVTPKLIKKSRIIFDVSQY